MKLEKIIKYGIYLSAFMPLIIFSDFLSPFHFGKVVIFRGFVEILLLMYVLLVLQDKKFLPKPNSIFIIVSIFTAIFGLTSFTSWDIYQSFWGTLERMGGWFTFIHFWVLFVMLISILRNKEDWLTLIKISVIVSLFSTLYGFLQKTDATFIVGAGGRSRIFGTLGNAALFAGYELFGVFLALLLFLHSETSKNAKYFYGLVFVLNSIAVFSTAVRGSILAWIFAMGFFTILYTYIGGSKKIRLAILFILTVLIAGEIFLIFSKDTDFVKTSKYLSRFADLSLQTDTAKTRIWAWQAGIDGWNDTPRTIMLGWGPENFNIPFSKHFNPKFFNGPGSETFFDRGHNMFIEILVTMGIIGLLAYVSIFYIFFRHLNKKIFSKSSSKEDKLFASILLSTLIAYIIHNFFIFDTAANFLAFFFVAGFIYFLNRPLSPEQGSRRIESIGLVNKNLAYSAVIILGIIIFFIIYITDIKPSLANYSATRAIVASWSGNHDLAIIKFKQALAYDTRGSYEIRHRYLQYLIEQASNIEPPSKAREALLNGIEEAKKNLRHKDDYLPYLYISRAYIILGKGDPGSEYNDLALENSFKALEISPTFIRTYYEIAQAYINKKDFARAIESFQKAIDLNPKVGISYWYKGVTQLDHGFADEGLKTVDEAVSNGHTLSESDYARLIKPYVQRNDYSKLVEIYEELLVLKPNNAQYHASLATAYARIGKIDDAVIQAREATKLDSTFEPEARAFVRSLGREW